MSKFTDNSIDCVFADYPFNIQDGKDNYVSFIKETANAFHRILVSGGNLVIVNNPSNHFKTLHFFSELFLMRNKIALIRKGAFYPAWHFGFAHNDAYFLVKPSKEAMKSKWNGNKVNHQKFDKDYLEYQNGNRTKNGWHPQAMPMELVQKWIGYITNENDIVYDPFTGSGTTWIACHNLHRQFVGSEFSEKYYNLTLKNVASETGLDVVVSNDWSEK
jgi:DNA modification methylase